MKLSDEEWSELVALKNAINYNPASVHFEKMELFTELLVRSWKVKKNIVIVINNTRLQYPNAI